MTERPLAQYMAVLLATAGCCRSAPPSQFPSAQAALDRMRATYACSRAIQGDATIEYLGNEGRMRGKVLYLVALPEQLRFDLYSPFGAVLSTLTANGRDFSLYDLRHREFLQGPATACNVARFTQVPVPPFALAQLLRGEAPVLVHQPDSMVASWECSCYRLRIASLYQASETIELIPRPGDWNRPWNEQRVRVLSVEVEQAGVPLYHAELSDYRSSSRGPPSAAADHLGPAAQPSGPPCNVEVPRVVRFDVPENHQALVLHNQELYQNPPLDPEAFRQSPPNGIRSRAATCQ